MTKCNPKRAALFKLVCLSLFTSSSMGFSTPMSTLPLHEMNALRQEMPQAIAGKRRSSSLPMASTTFISQPLLTLEEEKELLRQAVELRRLTELEESNDLNSQQLALAAGYGDSIDAYETAMGDGQRARELLVTRNMGLVHYCLKQMGRKTLNSLSREDLIQEGAIGLAKAVDRWNPAIGGKFSTYAVYWIRATILRGIADRDDLLRVPVHVSQAVKSIDKAAYRMGVAINENNWREFSKELQAETSLSEKNLEEAIKVKARRHGGGYIAFESWMQKGQDFQTDTPSQQEASLSPLETEHLRATLSKYLRPKEMEALSWRYGLVQEDSLKEESARDKANRYLMEAEQELFSSASSARKPIEKKGRWGEAMTFTEVGKKMQVSAEYGRKLCHAALEKLRRAADEGHLEPALLF